ncbi:MAG TPA: cupin domain-containing protein [Urbifossiella sp.]|jgi:oxalate decarboxylase|nr:cupin domain-containing protein [Urbifossiella sp.]
MSDTTRRGFLGAAATAGAATAIPQAVLRADIGSVNAPDPLLGGKELPTFKFELEKSRGKVIGKSSGKEATVEQLPISKGIAGVSMRLEPGAMRELHWHANAAEWAYVVEGRCRTTVIGPAGDAETNDFEPGDIWYFPRGHGHSIQCLGDQPCHFILIFDNGYFSEFGTFSVTDWIGHVPPALLEKNLGMPAATFAAFPKDEVYFARGPVPPAAPAPLHQGRAPNSPNTHKFRMLAEPPHSIHRGGREWRVGQDKFPISKTVTGVILELEPGGLRELHWHPNADEWQYVIAGSAVEVTMFGSHGRFRTETLNAGDVGYIPQGYGHSIENKGATVAKLVIAFNTGHYEAIDLSLWLASNPDYLLRDNFATTDAVVAKFPKHRVFIASKDGPGGPEPSPLR